MDAKNKTPEQKGKTIFIEYSSADPGQHFMTVLQTMPAAHRKQLIARITKEEEKGKCSYVAHGVNGEQLMISADLDRVKQHLTEHGHELAQQEMDPEKNLSQENSGAPNNQEELQEKKKHEKPASRTAQMKTIRAQKGGKKKTITR